MDKILNVANYISEFLTGNYNITKYKSNTKETICGFDGFIDLKFSSKSTVSKYWLHLGDFSSYNKVLEPTVIEIILCTKGSYAKIASVISTLENYKNSMELIDIQTPYGVYIAYNLIDLEYELTMEKGIGYVECKITARQIEVNSAQFFAIRNIENKPTNLLGKLSLVQSAIYNFEKVTNAVTQTVLGAQLIFGNNIKLR